MTKVIAPGGRQTIGAPTLVGGKSHKGPSGPRAPLREKPSWRLNGKDKVLPVCNDQVSKNPKNNHFWLQGELFLHDRFDPIHCR